ncbi:carbamoyltransferase [Roseimicrobium gellanilyticum]|uniref:Carbamoyltransferase n=1 Tax=Roseimicrobium gellanilyticum TaxID=748857 RepID=A0A366HP88_9BACT|nr:carbamoyltransferase C-terminal domain-containing protein [Roseimicrobium gellanilyticum]RBP45307.1 carbamoyltransferase [Roseimicrobium gellanilyticum]
MALVLGINAWHGDSSAAIIKDGKLIAAVEEERFLRIKHWAGLPVESMKYCLKEAGAQFGDLEHIAINLNPRVNNLRRLLHLIRHRPDLGLVMERLRKRSKAKSVGEKIADAFPQEKMRAEVHHIEHHLAHLASSYLCSPFDEAVNLSVDGMGDFASAAWGMGRGQSLSVEGRVYFPHSLGIFYSVMTQWLGFPHYGDEYKIMGLAPYGKPEHLDLMRQIVRVQADGTFELDLRYFRHHREAVPYTWDKGSPEVGTLYTPALEELLGPARKKEEPLDQRHKDIARSVQAMYEEAFFAMLASLHKKYQCDALTLSGGCAMNSVANGKVFSRSPFKKLYIQSAAGDAGGAIGAGMVVAQQLGGASVPRHHCLHAYWGPQFSEEDYRSLLNAEQARIRDAGCEVTAYTADETEKLCASTAQAISEGKVIGWFQGRLEWGPRALGNRSILGDPRRADMKDILNAKIKRRESFRPFAPSVLREAVGEWFETDDDVPFMMQVYQVREERRSKIPAVTHVDGSGRLQTVYRETNPMYHRVIEHFRDLTGVPMVLNTSFNENEPVVCHPKEALDCFLRTKMDVLVLGNQMLQRRG